MSAHMTPRRLSQPWCFLFEMGAAAGIASFQSDNADLVARVAMLGSIVLLQSEILHCDSGVCFEQLEFLELHCQVGVYLYMTITFMRL